MYDIVVKNGLVVDGSLAKPFRADIGIADGKICTIRDLGSAEADKIIDAENCIVSPGFVDIHTHADLTIQADPRAESQIRQGVTTQVVGSCGYGMAPCTDASREGFIKERSLSPVTQKWNTFAQYLEAIASVKPATNIAAQVGHGTIRKLAMADSTIAADFKEIEKMCAILEESLADGAFGMSTGLEYFPGKACQFIELEKLCQSLAKYNAVHASHVRNRDIYALSGFLEVIEVAKVSGSHLQISHVNPKFGRSDSTMDTLLHIIEVSRKEGCRIDLDVMPTNFNHTSPKNLLPVWALALSATELMELLDSPEGRERLQENPTPMWQLSVQNKWDKIYLFNGVKTKRFLGQSIENIAKEFACSGWDALCRLMLEEGENMGGMKLAGDSFYYADIVKALSDPFCSVCSDSTACATDGILASYQPSPNTYVWAEQFLRQFVHEDKILSIETAIHKLTALPASQINIKDRGLIKENYFADLTIFKLEELNDKASLVKPNVYAEGIEAVIVNGRLALFQGKTLENNNGMVLTP